MQSSNGTRRARKSSWAPSAFWSRTRKGKIKTHKLGARKTAAGAVIFGLAAVLTGGASLLAGAVFGGIVGSFFRKGLGISKEDLARIDGELNGGKAAVAVLAAPDEAAAVSAKLAELGGAPESHELSAEVVQEAETAAAAMPEEAPTEEPVEAVAEAPAEAPALRRAQNRPPPDRRRLARKRRQSRLRPVPEKSRRMPRGDAGSSVGCREISPINDEKSSAIHGRD